MKKNVVSKILAGTLVAAMVLGMAACGNGNDEVNPSGSDSGSISGSGNESESGNSGNESGGLATAEMTRRLP